MSRSCGECSVCCSGALVGSANGHPFYPTQPCYYLQQTSCTIYPDRPDACKNYMCAWIQNLFSADLYPPKCKFLVSVENDPVLNIQFFKVVVYDPNYDLNALDEVIAFATENQTYVKKVYSCQPIAK